MNHPYLDALTAHLRKFEDEHDQFVYGNVIHRLNNYVSTLYELDDEDENVHLVRSWITYDPYKYPKQEGFYIRDYRWLDGDGRTIGLNERWELIDLIEQVADEYWCRKRPEYPGGMRHTGYKRRYRKAKWVHDEFWVEKHWNHHVSRSWKDQRKTKHQWERKRKHELAA